ncbi:MAG: hypothetical protein NT062_23640 [Proteobacteria bacterium]|nr:hypothetical protein [Pseudomonadota bacterium]
MTTKRILELVDGGSTRFYELWLEGTTVMTRFGTSAGGAHLTAKDAGSVDEARRALDEQVHQALAKGYLELGAPAAATSVAQVGPAELAGKLAELPRLADDPAYLVFADWLQSHGDPWGELVAIHYNATTASAKQRAALDQAAAALLADRGQALLGPAALHPHSRFVWHLGFVRTATIGTSTDAASMVAAIDALLAQPVAHMIEGVVVNAIPARFQTHRDWDSSSENIVDPWTDETLAAIAKAIAGPTGDRVTHLGFGGWPAPAASAYLRMPRYTALNTSFAGLRRLELTGWPHEEPGTLDLPALVELEVRFAMVGRADLDAITSSRLPKLERLSVWLGGSAYCILDDLYPAEDGFADYPETYDGGDLEQLEVHEVNRSISAAELGGFIDALPATVKHLGIQSAMLDGELCAMLLAHPRLAALETLDLSGGTLDDATAELLLAPAAKAALGHLASLDLARNRLGAAMAKKLVAAFPNARVGDQREAPHPELFVRYVAVME